MKELTCIICPVGCSLCVEEENGEMKVSGNTCKRGEEYCILLYSEKKDNYLQNIGYIGEQLLNVDYQEKLFATMFLCGISKKKAFVIQFFQGFFVLLASVIIGRLILMFLYSVQFVSQYFVANIFLYITISALLVQMVISALFVNRMSKKSIVQILKGSDNR